MERTGEMNEIEREALLAFGALLADPTSFRFCQPDGEQMYAYTS